MFERGYYCYKWVKDGEIVYVGRTVSPKLRIAQERKTEKFQEFLDADIYVTAFRNATEMIGMEKLLINKYQPKLNVIDRNDTSMDIPLDDSLLKWVSFSKLEREILLNKEIERKKQEIKEREDYIVNCKLVAQIFGLVDTMLQNGITSQTFKDVNLCSLFEKVYGLSKTNTKYIVKKIDDCIADKFDEDDIPCKLSDFIIDFVELYVFENQYYTITFLDEEQNMIKSWSYDGFDSDIKISETLLLLQDIIDNDMETSKQKINDLKIEIEKLKTEKLNLKNIDKI